MTIIASKRRKAENILKEYPRVVLADVTSKATDELVKLSPFYPHGDIPVPFSEGRTATCVAFCYNKADDTLQHSFTELADFNKPPYLINCKDPLKEEGCRTGIFDTYKGCIIMVASDTLAHYILMMYEACHQDAYGQELETALNAHSKNSNFIKSALATKADFYDDVLKPLVKSTASKDRFRKHIDALRRQELIGFDDYSLAVIK